MVKLKGDPKAGSVSFGGKEYPVKKGIVEVPEEAVAALAAHGFSRIDGEQDNGEQDAQ